MKKIQYAVLLMAGAVLLSGCVVALGNRGGGGSGFVERKITLGQELSDLKKARDTGAITPAEYESLKCKLLQDKDHK